MTTYSCPVCMRIYEATIANGKMRYRIRNGAGTRIVMLLSDEQPCEDCIKRLEGKVREEKKVIQEETVGI